MQKKTKKSGRECPFFKKKTHIGTYCGALIAMWQEHSELNMAHDHRMGGHESWWQQFFINSVTMRASHWTEHSSIHQFFCFFEIKLCLSFTIIIIFIFLRRSCSQDVSLSCIWFPQVGLFSLFLQTFFWTKSFERQSNRFISDDSTWNGIMAAIGRFFTLKS